MADISFSMSADEKDVTKALQNLIKENAKLRAEIQTGVNEAKAAAAQEREFQKLREKATKDAVAQMNQLNAAAAKIKDSVATPFDMAKKKVQELREHLQAGRLTTDEYRKAYANVAKELKDATTDHEAAAQATREHSDDLRKAAKIIASVEDATDRYARAVKELDRLKSKGVLTSKQHAAALKAEQEKLNPVTQEMDGAAKATGAFTGSLAGIAAVGAGSVAFLTQLAGKLEELRTEMASDVVQFDKLSRKFGIQGSLSAEQRKEQSLKVGGVALKAGVQIDKAFETATQLSSSGFEDPVNSGTLDSALALMQSSNQIDGNAADFIKGSGQFMSAFGLKKDNENLKNLGIRMQGLFKSTDVQAGDLPEFAKAAPALAGAGLSLETSLSTLTALRETMNPGEAATGARNTVMRLQTAGTNKTAVEALKSIGLTPDQVDIQGEGLQQALDTLKGSTAKLGDADRAGVLAKIFGIEGAGAASILMNSTDKFDTFGAMQRNAGSQFQTDVATARSGAAADATRKEVSDIMDSARNEEAVRQNELNRNARISLRQRNAKNMAASGTLKGRFDAGVLGMFGAVEDNVIRPLIGESDNLGAAHAAERKRLGNLNAFGKENQFQISLPKELQNVMQEQVQVLKEIKGQNEQRAHAGIVANRAAQNRENN